MHREKSCEDGEHVASCKLWREASEEIKLADTYLRLQNWEKLNFFLSHPVWGILLCQPYQTNLMKNRKLFLSLHLWYLAQIMALQSRRLLNKRATGLLASDTHWYRELCSLRLDLTAKHEQKCIFLLYSKSLERGSSGLEEKSLVSSILQYLVVLHSASWFKIAA